MQPLFLLPLFLLRVAGQSDSGAIHNPVLAGADPHVSVIDGKAWLYPTGSPPGTPPGPPAFYAYSSTDLAHWQSRGPVLSFANVSWIGADGERAHYAWAPALAQKGKRFFFYFSVGPQGRTPSRIGVASGDSPAGPFKDSGRPLLTGGKGFEAIDPMVFCDPQTGKYYLYAGGSAGATLRVFELSRDMQSFAKEVHVETPPKFTEGVFMHYRKGTYYLSYSHGGWRDGSYSVHYATSNSPIGPWRYRGVILSSDAHHKGPGHHSVFPGPHPDEWFIAYHRWNNAQGNGPYTGSRQVAIDRLIHGPGPWINPVKMSD
jgi:beta-xylosidase